MTDDEQQLINAKISVQIAIAHLKRVSLNVTSQLSACEELTDTLEMRISRLREERIRRERAKDDGA